MVWNSRNILVFLSVVIGTTNQPESRDEVITVDRTDNADNDVYIPRRHRGRRLRIIFQSVEQMQETLMTVEVIQRTFTFTVVLLILALSIKAHINSSFLNWQFP